MRTIADIGDRGCMQNHQMVYTHRQALGQEPGELAQLCISLEGCGFLAIKAIGILAESFPPPLWEFGV